MDFDCDIIKKKINFYVKNNDYLQNVLKSIKSYKNKKKKMNKNYYA